MGLHLSLVVANEVHSSNITHNLGPMARAAGIYEHLWRPEEIGLTHARELIQPLSLGLQRLKEDREGFEKYSAGNGWGTYANFVPFVEKYLHACIANPNAELRVSR